MQRAAGPRIRGRSRRPPPTQVLRRGAEWGEASREIQVCGKLSIVATASIDGNFCAAHASSLKAEIVSDTSLWGCDVVVLLRAVMDP